MFTPFISITYSIKAGDLNARIGAKLDSIKYIDDLVPRNEIHNNVIDKHLNNHGTEFVNFLLETKVGIVNGRITPYNNSITSVVLSQQKEERLLIIYMYLYNV